MQHVTARLFRETQAWSCSELCFTHLFMLLLKNEGQFPYLTTNSFNQQWCVSNQITRSYCNLLLKELHHAHVMLLTNGWRTLKRVVLRACLQEKMVKDPHIVVFPKASSPPSLLFQGTVPIKAKILLASHTDFKEYGSN